MKYLNIYFKSFIIDALSLSFAITLYIFTRFRTLDSMKHALFISLILVLRYSVVLALVSGTTHILRARRLPSHDPDNITPFQSRTLKLPLDKTVIFKACLSSLELLNAKIIKQDFEEGQIKATMRASWASWGEEIEINLGLSSKGAIPVSVKSIPKLKLTPIDYGKNINNVEKILGFLEAQTQ